VVVDVVLMVIVVAELVVKVFSVTTQVKIWHLIFVRILINWHFSIAHGWQPEPSMKL
jgi:hypothetical protein